MVLVINSYICNMKNYIKYNRELKVIDNQDKAYLLGIIFGDGHVSKPNNFKVTIATSIEDKDLFLKLNKLFPFLRLKQYNNKPNVLFLNCSQKSLIYDLISNGCIPNKTKGDKEFNFNLPNLPEKLIPHFIRGFFDADGSVYTQTRFRSRNSTKTEIGLSTKNFLLQLKDILDKQKIQFKFIERKKSAGNGIKYDTYTLLSSNRETSLKFADYIYKDANLFLERKYIKFYSYIKSETQLRRELLPFCKHCAGTVTLCGSRVNKDGTKKLKIKCKSCSKMSSIPDLAPLVRNY